MEVFFALLSCGEEAKRLWCLCGNPCARISPFHYTIDGVTRSHPTIFKRFSSNFLSVFFARCIQTVLDGKGRSYSYFCREFWQSMMTHTTEKSLVAVNVVRQADL